MNRQAELSELLLNESIVVSQTIEMLASLIFCPLQLFS